MTQCLKNHFDIEDGAVCPRCGKRVIRILGREFDPPEGPPEVIEVRLSEQLWTEQLWTEQLWNAAKPEDGEK